MLAAYRDNDGLIGAIADTMANQTKGVYAWPDGSFRNAAPPMIQLAEIREARCFQTESYSVGDRGLHSVTEQPKQGDTISLPRYLGYSDAAARSVTEASPAERDPRLLDYFKVRKTMGSVIHRFFGGPGLQEAAVRYGYYAHQTAIAMLRQRLTDPSFASTLILWSGRNSIFSPQLRRTSSPAPPAGRKGKQGLEEPHNANQGFGSIQPPSETLDGT